MSITTAVPPLSSLGGRGSTGAAQPRLEGCKVRARPADEWLWVVGAQGVLGTVQLQQRPQAWGWTEMKAE